MANPRREEMDLMGVVVRVEPKQVQDFLIKSLSTTALASDEEVSEKVHEISKIVKRVGAYTTAIIKYMLSDIDAIIPVTPSKSVVVSKIVTAGRLLAAMYERELESLMSQLRQKFDEQTIEELIAEIRFGPALLFLALMYIMDRIETLVHINLPAPLRPPLANLKVGLEVIR